MASRAPVIVVVAAVIMAAARLASGSGYYPVAAPFTSSSWQDGSATFYGDGSGLGADFGGACGYGANDIQSLYSTRTAALSTPLFAGGAGCGQCYELRCVNSRWCNPGSPSVVVTGTNLCPPNWYLPSDNGGWCNPPRQHFDLAPPSFLLLAERVAGIVPVQFRRVPCQRSGGVRFYVQGNYYWLLLYVMNVAGSGDVSDLAVKRAGEPDCSYVPASHNWGITHQVFAALGNAQGLVVRMTSYSAPQKTIVVGDAIPAWWSTGLSYQGSSNFY
ncbi:Expansin-A17 [Zea mays]|uniref:Expansin n=2 Tax=Zea mays TaxID=4577 RepID=K7VT40_MAIZE|nr:expansin-A17 [Zea mays]AQL02616.1 Expansin-A7 [Zea mays]PWZ05490.1 Expansin-A17 [Zea mays]|eukprot:XP_008660764.1 expansin-A17 [Zea mays]